MNSPRTTCCRRSRRARWAGTRPASAGSSSAGVLHEGHQSLQAAASAPDEGRAIASAYRECIEQGTWFSPERTALDRQVTELEASVNGIVRLQVQNDACAIIAVQPLDAGKL